MNERSPLLLLKNDKEGNHHLQLSGPSNSDIIQHDNDVNNTCTITTLLNTTNNDDGISTTLASVAGNVLEWYDFAIYGYFADIIGSKFFPPTNDKSTSIIESFLVFGGAFLVRPVGGMVMGYIGDTTSTKRALEISIFLMALPTFIMGCLPTYNIWGWGAVIALVFVRLLQGLSVGGQLMSSLVFVAEGHDRRWWGWYGSFAMTAANIGTMLGGVCGFGMRHFFTTQQLEDGLWRVPFICGVFVSASGFYLKHNVKDHEKIVDTKAFNDATDNRQHAKQTPLQMALSKDNIGNLASVTASVVLWSGGFYVLFVWLVICMTDFLEHPVQHAFAISVTSLFMTMVVLFPFAGWLSDRYGRRQIMTIGASGIALLSPLAMKFIDSGHALIPQLTLGTFLALYGSPLCAFLIENFPAESRLTSVAIGYNTSMAIAGGLSPSLATWLVREYGVEGAGYLLSTYALISLCGIYMTPKHDYS